MMALTVLQVVETFDSMSETLHALDALKREDSFLGGRVLGQNPMNPRFRLQAFFRDEGRLPDGMRRVAVPNGLREYLFETPRTQN